MKIEQSIETPHKLDFGNNTTYDSETLEITKINKPEEESEEELDEDNNETDENNNDENNNE